MTHRIADTFYDALAKLSPQEQKAVKQSAFDFQMDPSLGADAIPLQKWKQVDSSRTAAPTGRTAA